MSSYNAKPFYKQEQNGHVMHIEADVPMLNFPQTKEGMKGKEAIGVEAAWSFFALKRAGQLKNLLDLTGDGSECRNRGHCGRCILMVDTYLVDQQIRLMTCHWGPSVSEVLEPTILAEKEEAEGTESFQANMEVLE